MVVLKCIKKGCPRSRKISIDKKHDPEVPKGTTVIRSYCPWHTGEGWKDYPEYYYDKDGNELDYDD